VIKLEGIRGLALRGAIVTIDLQGMIMTGGRDIRGFRTNPAGKDQIPDQNLVDIIEIGRDTILTGRGEKETLRSSTSLQMTPRICNTAAAKVGGINIARETDSKVATTRSVDDTPAQSPHKVAKTM
jgi:hypothetical protein